jgi:hypothetical protein
MKKLELSFTKEQMGDFLDSEFKSFMDNSQSPDPTNGIPNYAHHMIEAKNICQRNKILMPLEIQPFFAKAAQQGLFFELSVEDIIGQTSISDDPIQAHYNCLSEMPLLYDEGTQLIERKIKNSEPELSNVVGLIKGQIIVANHLYNPSKRNTDFRYKIWGETIEFVNYIKTLNE